MVTGSHDGQWPRTYHHSFLIRSHQFGPLSRIHIIATITRLSRLRTQEAANVDEMAPNSGNTTPWAHIKLVARFRVRQARPFSPIFEFVVLDSVTRRSLREMVSSALKVFPFALASALATTTVYMRIEGPTHTIYEETIQAVTQTTLTNNGHTGTCDGTPEVAAGITSLTALAQTGQSFTADWNGTTFGGVTHINGTTNSVELQWGVLFNDLQTTGAFPLQGDGDGTNLEYEQFCFQTLPNDQHMLYAFFGDAEETSFLFLTGPPTAVVGVPVDYTAPFAVGASWVNDLSTDATTAGERVHADLLNNIDGSIATATITFTEPGTYNMKAHCGPGTQCVRSNHIVTVVTAGEAPAPNPVYLRIEGPTHTIYEQTLDLVTQTTLSNNGNSATCDGTPEMGAGATALTALEQTGQDFYTNWNGSTFGKPIHINGTTNNDDQMWQALFLSPSDIELIGFDFDNSADVEYEEYCYQVIPYKADLLFAFYGNFESTFFMFLSGPSTATVGVPVNYTTGNVFSDSYVNDLSTDVTTGERVHADFVENLAGDDSFATITFAEAGTYYMKGHCAPGSNCVRSNQIVTVVSG